MSKSTKPSIASIGLMKYLNSTKQMHNDQGWKEFDMYVYHKVPLAVIGRLFHVGRPTIVKWHEIYLNEQEKII